MQATFTGQEYDDENGLQYFGARYLNNQEARFYAVDPATLKIYNEEEFQAEYGRSLVGYLADPQNLNSYSYVTNNPVKFVDPNGESGLLIILGWIGLDFVFNVNRAVAPGLDYNESQAVPNQTSDLPSLMSERYNNLSNLQKSTVMMLVTMGKPKFAVVSRGEIAKIIKQADNAFQTALEGGTHSNWMKIYLDKSIRELEKGIKSFGKNVQVHIDKLFNPAAHIDDFENASEQYIRGQIEQWKTHLRRNQEQQNILKGLLERLKKSQK